MPTGIDRGWHIEGLVDYDVFASINTRGKLGVLASWRTAVAAKRWTSRTFVLDYNMFDRREAPRYYPDGRK